MTKIMGTFHGYADAPKTCNNKAEDIVVGATVQNVVAQAARHPEFVHHLCNTCIHNNEICVIMVDFKKNITFCAPDKKYFVLFKLPCHANYSTLIHLKNFKYRF